MYPVIAAPNTGVTRQGGDGVRIGCISVLDAQVWPHCARNRRVTGVKQRWHWVRCTTSMVGRSSTRFEHGLFRPHSARSVPLCAVSCTPTNSADFIGDFSLDLRFGIPEWPPLGVLCRMSQRALGSPQGVCQADAPIRLRVTTERRPERTPVTAHTSADPKGTWTWSPNSVCPRWSTPLRLCSVTPRPRLARYQGACVARHRSALDGPCSGSPAEMAILRGTAAMGRGVGSPSHRSFNPHRPLRSALC